MAEQVFSSVNCGFFPSQNGDRLYTADDMNRPYNRLISNGVFATQSGTPSTDLQVLAVSGLGIKVSAGQGLFGDKWFENPADIAITAPSNNGSTPRIDAVVVQVNKTQAVRAGRIIYRTGTPSSTPVAPALTNDSDVAEYRLANVYVGAQAAAISQSNITDTRGSSECPWVTSLIKQVDTSELFIQWQDAYRQLYASADAAIQAYIAQAESDWDAFFESLTQDITAVANVLTLQSTQTATAGQTTFPLNIASYNSATDVLMVFINGLMANSAMYSVSGTNVILVNALGAGDKVTCLVFKSIVQSDLTTVQGLIAALDAKVDSVVADTGWVSCRQGVLGDVSYRKYGKAVYVKGRVEGSSVTAGGVIGVIPYVPNGETSQEIYFFGARLTTAFSNTEVKAVCMRINSNGEIQVLYDNVSSDDKLVFSMSYMTA